MSIRLASTQLLAPGILLSQYAGHGVRGDAIPPTGTHGPAPLYAWLTLPADAANEYRWAVTTPPTVGDLVIFEDGSYTYTPPPATVDLLESFDFDAWENGTLLGSATYTITIGSPGGTVHSANLTEAVTLTDAAVSSLVAAVAALESLSLSDVVAAVAVAQAVVDEAVTASDTQATGPVTTADLTESASLADALTAAALLVGAVAENVTAADVATSTAQLVALLTEAATAADAVTGTTPTIHAVSLTELASALDLLSALLSGESIEHVYLVSRIVQQVLATSLLARQVQLVSPIEQDVPLVSPIEQDIDGESNI